MDTEMTTEKVLIKKDKLSVNIEQLIETDLSLADYYGDIVKILGVNASTNILSAAVTSDKAVIDGSVTLRMLYIDSDGKTETADCAVPFSRSIDLKNACDSDNLTAECISEQINCRAVNQRRAEIRGSVTLKVKVSGTEECCFITETPKGFCHALKSTCDGYILQGAVSKRFSLNAESGPGDKFRGAKLCRIFTLPTVSETKTIKNKMMIRGSVSATAVYVTPDGQFATERITEPVNQIVDMEGIDEASVCCVTLKTVSADGRFTPDSPQSPPKIEIAMTACAEINAFGKGSVTCIDEAYSSTHELICESDTAKCVTGIQHLNDNHAITTDFDFPSCSVATVDDAAVRKIKYTCHKEDNDMIIKGNIHYGIILTTKENDRMYFERTADFEYRKQLSDTDGDHDFSPSIYINAVTFSHNGDSSARITTELHIDGFVYSCRSVTGLVSARRGAERQKNTGDCIITAYFATKGERLWDIAKSHFTSADSIRQMNDIVGDTVETDRMLIFEQE